jgi:hypothetical protein
MKNIRLFGKLGENDGIVFMRTKLVNQIWIVTFDTVEPTNLSKAKLKEQLR